MPAPSIKTTPTFVGTPVIVKLAVRRSQASQGHGEVCDRREGFTSRRKGRASSWMENSLFRTTR